MAHASDLRAIVGDDFVREAVAADAIDGVAPRLVVQPGTVEEVGQVMAHASRTGSRVAPRGGGTKLGWGNPPVALDWVVDLARLNRLLEHAAGDLVVSVEAGLELESLQARLAEAGQMLALDSSAPGTTVGGTIATNASGPRRFRYGTVRDLLIGVTIVLADGTIAKAGGKVVKNVAGYDLGKLVTGSLGTLGVIVKAIFRLHPRPPAQRLVEADVATAADVGAAVQRLLHSTLVPAAIQLSWPSGGAPRIGVLFEGIEPSVIAQAERAAELLGGDSTRTVGGRDQPQRVAELVEGDSTAILEGTDEVERGLHELTAISVSSPGDLEIKVSCLPSDLATILTAIRETASRHGRTADLTGILGNGILRVRLEHADSGGAVEVVRELRSRVAPGSVVVLGAPLEVKRQLDVWGPVGDALGLMRRVKDRFDPDHLLNPGRFVGGI